jgi:Domain of unknown function (DUF1996)
MIMRLLLLAAALAPCAATFRAVCQNLVFAHADPLVSPGRRSGHEHSIGGSLAFSPSYVSAPAMRAAGSSCDVVGDRSLYWAPSVWQGDMRLTPIHQAYYDAPPVGTLTSFANVSMITHAARFLCRLGNRTLIAADPSNAFHRSAEGCVEMRIDYTFPDCWSGGAYAADQSHVAVASRKRGCPPTHPLRIPTLRLEQRYVLPAPTSWSAGEIPFSISGGDAHADAVVVWDAGALRTLVETCPGPIADCEYVGVARRSRKETEVSVSVPSEYL